MNLFRIILLENQGDFLADQQDMLTEIVPEMFLRLFGKEMLERSQLEKAGNYCWKSRNLHLMLFIKVSVSNSK